MDQTVKELSFAKMFRFQPEGHRKSVGVFKQMSHLIRNYLEAQYSVYDGLVWGKIKEDEKQPCTTGFYKLSVPFLQRIKHAR